MEAGRGLVEDVELAAPPYLRERQLTCDLEALGLAARQRGGGLAQPQVAEPHLLQVPQRAGEARPAVEPLERLVHRPLEHVVDRAAVQLHLQHVLLEALSLAHLAWHEHVGEEHHLDQHVPRALARLAPAPPRDVEREGARRVAARARQRLGGEQRAQLVERLDVGDRVGSRRAADRRLVHEHHVPDPFPPVERAHLAHRLAQMLLGAVAAAEPGLELVEQDVVHQRRLPRARHAGDRGQRPERNARVHAVQVVQPGTPHGEPALGGTARRRHADALLAGEVLPRERAGVAHARRRALVDELAAGCAAPRSQLDHPVGGAHRGGIVLHYHHGVPGVREPPQQLEQPVGIGGMQPDGRLVEHVQRVHEMRPQGVRQRDALGLAARQGAREPVEREVSQSHVVHERDPRAELGQDVNGHGALELREREAADPVADGTGRQPGDGGDRLVAHLDRQRLRLEPRATTRRAGLGELVLPQEDADVLLVALRFESHEERKHAEEAPARAVQQEVPVALGQVAPRGVERDSAGARRLAQAAAPALVAGLGPGVERAAGQAAGRVGHDERLVVLEHGAEAVAGGACAPRIVEGEQRGHERGRGGAAVRAGGMRRVAAPVAVLERHGYPLALAERGGDGVGETPAVRFGGGQAIDHDQHFPCLSHPTLDVGPVESHHGAVELRAHEPGGAQLGRDFHLGAMGALREGECDQDS